MLPLIDIWFLEIFRTVASLEPIFDLCFEIFGSFKTKVASTLTILIFIGIIEIIFSNNLMLETNALHLRIRMPITDTMNTRNFITKITTYEKICSIQNSMTVLTELIPLSIEMMKNGEIGTFNFTNPGTISHNEILEMYRDIVDPTFTWKNFTIEEQDKILLGKRSNNLLDTSKLESKYSVLSIKESVKKCLESMKNKC